MANKYKDLSLKIIDKLKEKEDEKETLSKDLTESNENNQEESKPKTLSSDSQEKTNTDKIFSDLTDIENKYKNKDYIDAPDTLGLERVDVPNQTEEELTTLAKSSLENKYKTKKEDTVSNFSKQIDNLLSKMESYKNSATKQTDEVNEIYNKGIKETENQALKRGLARSSIIISQISNLESDRASELNNVLNNLNKNILDTEDNISKLENEKDIALNNLDLEYAEELDEEIIKLKDKYTKAKAEAIEFNNKVSQLESEYKLTLDKQKLDKVNKLTKLEKEYGDDYTKNLILNEQVDYLKKYFDTLEPSYAVDLFLTNREFKDILKDRYSEIYKYLTSR